MKPVYQADHFTNAHIVKQLLENEGIPAHVSGEFLQGGVGDLPAVGMVQVMVAEENYEQARALVLDWESARPDIEEEDIPGTEPAVTPRRSGSWLLAGLFGILLGIAGTTHHFHTPTAHDGIDYDGDGVLDERWTFVHDIIAKSEIDRNHDGKSDVINIFDRHGMIESSTSDTDFDGVFDTESRYSEGFAVWSKSDTTGDGFKDFVVYYKHGEADRALFIDPQSKLPVKVEHYDRGRATNAELDTNGDGKLDTVHEYDAIGEIVSSHPK